MGAISLPHGHSLEPGAQAAAAWVPGSHPSGWTPPRAWLAPSPSLAGRPQAGHDLQSPGRVTVGWMEHGQIIDLSLHLLGTQQ